MSNQPKLSRFAHLPLRTVLIGPFVTLTVLLVGLVGYLSFRNGQQAVNEVAQQLRAEITARIESHVRTFLDTPLHINRLNADALRQGWLVATDPAALEQHLWKQIQNFDSVSSIYFANPAGGLVDAGREGVQDRLYIMATEDLKPGPLHKYATDQTGQRTYLQATVPKFDARTRPWYTAALNHNGPAWSEPYILSTGQDLAIAASRPVYDDQQKLLGVVSVDIFLTRLSDFLRSLSIGKSGQSFIIERSGLLIASSTTEKPVTAANGKARLHAAQSASPLIRAADKALSGQFGSYDHLTVKQQLEFELEGQRHFVNITPLQTQNGIDWLIVVIVPESDFMAHLKANNFITAALSVLALLTTIILGFVAAAWITRPVSQLKVAAQNLVKGKWQPVPSAGRIDEIKDLTHSFNHMAGQLQQTLASLTAEISTRQAMEARQRELLAERERLVQRMQLILERMPLGCIVNDPDFRVTYWNPAAERIFGFSAVEVLGKLPYETSIPSQAKPYVEMIQQRMAQGDLNTHTENKNLTKDGRTIFCQWHNTPLFEADGAFVGYLTMVQDITERKQAEETLRRYEHIVAATPDLMAIIDRNYIYLIVNQPYVTFTRKPYDQIVGHTVAQVMGQAVFETIKPYLDRALAGEAIQYETWLDYPSVGRRFVSLTYSPYRETDEQIAGLVVSRRDLTDLNLLQERLGEAQKMEAVGQLAAGMAHHYNSMLTAIIGFTSISLHTLPPDDPIAKNLNRVLTTAERAAVLVRQLLAFARKQLLRPKTVSLNELVLNLKGELDRLAAGSIELRLALAPDLGLVNMDPGQFEHLLLSLVANACDAMPHGGRLTLTTANVSLDSAEAGSYQLSAGEYILLTVQDTGIGLTEEVKVHLFEPFFTTKEVGQGTGLGLPMSFGIAKQHGGHLLATGQPGQGAAFQVYLPRVKAPAPPVTQPAAASLPSGTETILLVEEEPAVRDLVAQILSRQGYTVLKAADGEAALQLMGAQAGHAPQLLLTNMMAPGLSGYRLAERLQAGCPGLKVLFFIEPTGEGFPESNRPDIAFLAKPFKPSTLAQKVRAVLATGPSPAAG